MNPTSRVAWLLPTLSAAALLACNKPKLDQDGDGFTELTGDCDDLDANVHPDAQEVCDNGIDDNCNGVEDEEGATSGRIWYIDLDGDGYGKAEVTLLACEQPQGYAAEKWDCQEDNADIHPGAVEVCDAVDNDCDGQIDEASSEGTLVWYPDRDGDGFGDDTASVFSCDPIEGFVQVGGDCNDSDPGMNPDRTEVCTTPLDEDCDGSINDPDAYGCTEFYADQDGDGHAGTGACLCEAEAPYTETEPTDCDDTRANIYPGAPITARFAPEDCDAERTIDLSEPDATIYTSEDLSDHRNLAYQFWVEDLRGDGTLGVLASNRSDRAVWLDGPLLDQTTFEDARLRFPHPEAGIYGYLVSTIDDLDGDGTRDFAWGWSGDDTYPSGMYFFSGAAEGDLEVDDALGFVSVNLRTFDVYTDDRRRAMVTGDFDTDGLQELYILDAEHGPIVIHPGLASLGSTEVLAVPDIGGTVGALARVFDVNSDGIDDLVLSGYYSQLEAGFLEPRTDVPTNSSGYPALGAVLVYEGPLSAYSTPAYWLYGIDGYVGTNDNDFAFMDLNGDGDKDLLLSQYRGSFIEFYSGLVWVVDGPISSTMTGTDWPSIWDGEMWLNGVEPEEELALLDPIPDITGDGRPDLLARGWNGTSYLVDRFEPGHRRIDEEGRRFSEYVCSLRVINDRNGDGVSEVMIQFLDPTTDRYRVALFFGDAP